MTQENESLETKVDETFWHDRPAVSAVIQAHKDVAHAEFVLDCLILAATEEGVSYRELSSATGMAPSWLHTRANRARKLRPDGQGDLAAMSLVADDRVSLWPFYEAPKEYQALSNHGGDEDWVMFVPDALLSVACGHSNVAMKIEPIRRAIGVCDTSDHRVDGGMVFIGAHS